MLGLFYYTIIELLYILMNIFVVGGRRKLWVDRINFLSDLKSENVDLIGRGGNLEKKNKFLLMPPHLLNIREVPNQLLR